MKINKLQNCFVNISTEDRDAVNKALGSDVISGKSKYVEKFENNLCEYFHTKHSVTCTNGTSAIQMALYVFNVKKGDEVMLPPTAPIMSVLPILAIEAIPVFVDLKSNNNFQISIEDINKKFTNKTKVIMNVPMWGYPNNSNELQDFCLEKKVYLLEDLSHCHGTTLADDRKMGSVGDISIFSTHERKMITTGEGGFLLTNNKKFYEGLIKLRSFGVGHTYEYGKEFGLNYRLSGINAALGITQLNKLKNKIRIRTNNAKYLLNNLNMNNGIEEIKWEGGAPNYYALALIFNENLKKYTNKYSKYLYEYNIVSDTYIYKYKPLYKMPLLSKFTSKCLFAEKLIDSIITLPTHEGLKKSDLNYIIEKFNKFKK